MAEILSFDRYNKSPVEKVRHVYQQFERALDGQVTRRDRLFENLEMYWGDQIPIAIKEKMTKRNREAVVHNILYRKVSGLVGSLMRNDFVFNFLPIDGNNTSLIYAAEDMYNIDREWTDFDYHLMKLITYGLISEGVMEITTTDKLSPLGNLAFEVCQPGTVVLDNNWRSDNSSDMVETFKFKYLTPSQIMEIYDSKEDDIKREVIQQLQHGRDYEERDVDFAKDYEDRLGTAYRVIEYTYLENEKVTSEIDIESGCKLPDTDDVSIKMAFIEANDINVDYIRSVSHTEKICKVVTICPELLDVPLEDRDHRIQIGRLPFFPFAAERIGGTPRGIVDILKDLQKTLNKRENNLNHIIQSSAHGGGAIDPTIVGNDPVLKKLIQDNWSNPQFKFWTKEGALAGGKNYFQEFPKNTPPSEIFAQINQLWDSMDRMIPLNPAAEGRVESASEPGVLFSLKTQAIEVAQTTLNEALNKCLTEMGESYLKAAKQIYSNVERTFTRADGTKIVINEMESLPNGDIAINNDISMLPICRVTVKTGPDSPNSKFTRRVLNLDLLRVIPPEYQTLRASVLAEILNTIEMSDEYREQIDIGIQRALEVAQSREKAEAAQLGAVIEQTAMQQQQMAAQQQAAAQPQIAAPQQAGPQGQAAQPPSPEQLLDPLTQGGAGPDIASLLGPLLAGSQGAPPQ